MLTSFHKQREFDISVYSCWQRPCKFIKLIEVGRGHVSLLSYVLLWSSSSWKLRSFLE